MLETHKELAKEIIRLTKKKNVELATVSIGNATSFQVNVRNQKIDLLKEAGSSGVTITLCNQQRRSTLTSNDLRIEVIEPLINSTIETLPYMGQDEYYSLPDSHEQGRAEGDLEVYDSRYSTVESQDKIARALELEQETLQQDQRLQTEQSDYSDMISHWVYADSNGFVDGYTKTHYSTGMSAFVEDASEQGENKARKQTDGWYSFVSQHDELEEVSLIAQKTAERVLGKLGTRKPKTQQCPIVFSPEMARGFLSGVCSAISGGNIYRKNSFLVDQLNAKVAHENINLVDDPLIPKKLGSRYFDSEGVKAKPLILMEKGILKNYMLSTYSAKKLGMRTTGHSGGISNVVLSPGKYVEQELISSVKNGLYLTSLSGQGANITSGDYSRGAKGIWIENGKLSYPVSEFTIASTFQNILQNITMIASEVDARSSILSPAFKVDSMSVSGT